MKIIFEVQKQIENMFQGTYAYSIHGALMIFGFLCVMNLGAYIARHLKKTLGRPWFYLHIALQLLGALAVHLSFVLIILHFQANGMGHFQDTHHVLGLGTMILMEMQIILGIVAHFAWPGEGRGQSPIDHLHRALGVLMFLFVFMTVATGSGALFGALWLTITLPGLISLYSFEYVMVSAYSEAPDNISLEGAPAREPSKAVRYNLFAVHVGFVSALTVLSFIVFVVHSFNSVDPDADNP